MCSFSTKNTVKCHSKCIQQVSCSNKRCLLWADGSVSTYPYINTHVWLPIHFFFFMPFSKVGLIATHLRSARRTFHNLNNFLSTQFCPWTRRILSKCPQNGTKRGVSHDTLESLLDTSQLATFCHVSGGASWKMSVIAVLKGV